MVIRGRNRDCVTGAYGKYRCSYVSIENNAFYCRILVEIGINVKLVGRYLTVIQSFQEQLK